MVLLVRVFYRLLGRNAEGKGTALKRKPISCLSCNKAFALKRFPATNGVCPRCGSDRFGFFTGESPHEEVGVEHDHQKQTEEMRGRMLIQYLKNHDLV